MRRVLRRQRRDLSMCTSGECTSITARWLKIWRWLDDLARQAESPSPGAHFQAQSVAQRLRQTFNGLGAMWEARTEHLVGTPLAVLRLWRDEARHIFEQMQQDDARERRAGWRTWVQECVHTRPGLLYQWLRGNTLFPIQAVPTATACISCYNMYFLLYHVFPVTLCISCNLMYFL